MTNFFVIFLTSVSPLSLSDGWNVFINDDATAYRNETLEALKTNLFFVIFLTLCHYAIMYRWI